MLAEIQKCEELAHVPIPLLFAKTDEELKIQLLSEQAHDFVGKPFSEKNLLVRVRNQIELNKSQEQHRTLFTEMDEGFCTIEVLFDERQRPIDYRFLEISRAFEKQTGLTGVIGKRMRELVPHHEQHWFDIYGTIALTGRPARFENRAEALNRWYEVYAFPVGASEHRHVAVFFNDITERKGVEAALRDSEERLLALSGRLEQLVEERTEELAQSQDRLRALATELNLAEQRERKRIASELHDHLQQLLVLGKLKLGQGSQCKSIPDCIKVMTETDAVLTDALRYTRTLVAELSPPVLLEHGLAAGLKWLGEQMRQYQMTVTVECMSDELRLPEDHAMLLFQSVRELLINSAKHAESGRATVRMGQNRHRVHIEVQDLGKGFDPLVAAKPQATTPHSSKFGLFSIRERVKAVGGRFEIQSASGQGTTVFLELPLTEPG
jgi:PAS domain S-box-containing protein